MIKQTTIFEEHAYGDVLALQDEMEAQEAASKPRIWYSERQQRYNVLAYTRDLERIAAHGPTAEAAYEAWRAEYERMGAEKALPWWHWKRWLA